MSRSESITAASTLPGADGLLMVDAATVTALLSPTVARASQRRAFLAAASGDAVIPPRLLVPGDRSSLAFCYAGRLSPSSFAVSKFGSVNPDNAAAGLPAVNAIVTVLDPATGAPTAVLEGTSLTTLRTAAASAVAVDALAPAGARRLIVVGGGVQGRAHIAVLEDVRPWDSIVVVARDRDRAETFADEVRQDLTAASEGAHDGLPEVVAATAEEVFPSRDVVVLCTSSVTPVLDESSVLPGATVVSIGCYAPERFEIPASLLPTGHVVVDDVDSCLTDCGPLTAAVTVGSVDRSEVVTLGEVLRGDRPGRRTDGDVVVYLSVGLGIQDAAAAEAVLDGLAARTAQMRAGQPETRA